MSSDQEREWLIIIPDIEGALSKRMSVRGIHMHEMRQHIDSGLLQMGGALLSEHPQTESEHLDIKGSIIVARATSREDVVKILKQDIYFRSEVWEWDKIQIYPFKCVYRQGL